MNTDRRKGGGVTDPAPLVGLGALALAFVLLGLLWLGGTLGAWAFGAGWHPPRFGLGMLFELMRGRSPWPGVPTAWVAGGIAVLSTVVTVAATAAAIWAVRRWGAATPGLATAADVADFTFRSRITQVRRLRPSLKDTPDKNLSPRDVGLFVGKLAQVGRDLLASLEDVILVIAGPRSGKTSRIVANLILDAVGFTVVTSARYDAYAITARARERKGKVWLFDPQHIAHGKQQMWWDILSMARTLEGARRLATHLTKAEEEPGERGGDAFFSKAGRSTLTNFLHAAAIGGRTLEEMLSWTSDQRDRTAASILRKHGLEAMADSLDRMTRLAQETQDGVYEHVRQAVMSLYDPSIAAWVTPSEDAEEFVPEERVGSTDTLYMLSKDGGGGAAGILAALTDACFAAAVRHAESTRGGRMDPPMRAILDEAANVCKIDDLPKMYSYLGGFGINVVTILQSYRQGSEVWGRDGMDALWGAATVKLLGAGLDDYSFLDQVSHLVGMRAIIEESLTSSRGGPSTTRSRRRERILDASEMRELERGRALMLATSTRPALLDLLAWFERSDADQLTKDKAQVDAQIERDAKRKEAA